MSSSTRPFRLTQSDKGRARFAIIIFAIICLAYLFVTFHRVTPNIIAVDYDPGASEVNQLNRIKLMLSTAQKNLKKAEAKEEKTKRPKAVLRGTLQHSAT